MQSKLLRKYNGTKILTTKIQMVILIPFYSTSTLKLNQPNLNHVTLLKNSKVLTVFSSFTNKRQSQTEKLFSFFELQYESFNNFSSVISLYYFVFFFFFLYIPLIHLSIYCIFRIRPYMCSQIETRTHIVYIVISHKHQRKK